MKIKKKVPELRFPEFSGEWEEKRLRDVSKVNQGLQIPIKDRLVKPKQGSYFYITNEFLKENSKTKYYINNPPKSVICNENDVLMTRTGNTGIVITGVSGAFHNNFFKIDYDKNILNKNFLVMTLSSRRMQKDILIAAGQSTISDLTHSDFYKLKIKVPSILEQQKIGNFFSTLDQRIELQQKKIENLEEEKKGIMQKVFNQEIRFKDENGNDYPEWEEKKLGEIGFFKTSSVDKKIYTDEMRVKLVNYMDVYKHKKIFKDNLFQFMDATAKDSQLKGNNLLKGDILFTPSSETPEDIGHSIAIFENLNNAVYSYHVLRFRPSVELDVLFSHYFCNTSLVRNQIIRFATGSTRFTVSIKDFSEVIVKIPVIEEQQKIANFLSAFDSKIEKEREKFKQLKELKRGLLQKMFI